MSSRIKVESMWDGNEGKAIVCRARGLEVTVDHPLEEHGTNLGPTPSELLVMSLIGCFSGALIATARFLSIPIQKVIINATAEKGEREYRGLRSIELAVRLIPDLSDEERFNELVRQAKKNCTISNTLTYPPSVIISKAQTDAKRELELDTSSPSTT